MISLMTYYRIERIEEIEKLLLSETDEKKRERLIKEKDHLLEMNERADKIDALISKCGYKY